MSRTQFSLRTLLAAVAVVGIGAALWVAEPSSFLGAIEFFLVPLTFASAVAVSMHSTGRAKVFWIGFAAECIWPILVYLPVALVFSLPHSMISKDKTGFPYLDSAWPLPIVLFGIAENFRPVLIAWAFAPVVGLLCVLTHWLLVRPASAERKD